MKEEFDFIHIEFSLSDGTERIVYLRDDEYNLEDELGKMNDENPYYTSDMQYFIDYIACRISHGFNLDEKGLFDLVCTLPDQILGHCLRDPLPDEFFEKPIPEGVYMIDITYCNTSQEYAVSHDLDFIGRETKRWMWIASRMANPLQ